MSATIVNEDHHHGEGQHQSEHGNNVSFLNDTARMGGPEAEETASTTTVDPTTITFVDYRRPPSAMVRPPSKYKLWLVVFVLVYLAVWAAEGANLSQALRLRGWLSPDGAEFLELASTVFVLVFGALDVAMAIGTIHYKGKEYGLGPWMKCGQRIQWVHQTRYSDSFLMECLKGTIYILEEGFSMFNAPPAVALRPSGLAAVNKGQNHEADHLRNPQGSRAGTHRTTFDQDEKDPADGNDSYHSNDGQYNDEALYSCTSDDCKTLVKIEHRINPEKMMEYRQWEKRIQRAAESAPGLISIKRMDIVEEEIMEGTEKDGAAAEQFVAEKQDVELGFEESSDTKETAFRAIRVLSTMKKRPTFRHSTTTGYSTTANLHVIFMTFQNIYSLNDWMMSPRRKALMRQLEPLLALPDQELIQAERAATARDAFTNLTIQQGQYSPTLPPKKWKVWWLTTVALVISIRWSTSFLAYYLEFWGLDQAHPRLKMLVIIFIVTFLNSYITTPFLLFLFQPWLIRRPNEVDERFIWKTLDDGIESMWLKSLLTFTFYGGCVIAGIVQKYA
ncbi:hypothetical protein IV203_005080 [Nitzschia inconspicua]|uniref:Uncharacterized protein n=1 Tax=Nitzschia inconspicua TaxID=303405 RepID=A0A9K3KLQ4_9STRA|nr:hypothetical protein IV203_005080 [Nitzschia inconspicua]